MITIRDGQPYTEVGGGMHRSTVTELVGEVEGLRRQVDQLEKAGDRIAHQLPFSIHPMLLGEWWKARSGRCSICDPDGHG